MFKCSFCSSYYGCEKCNPHTYTTGNATEQKERQMKYKLIESLGLRIRQSQDQPVIQYGPIANIDLCVSEKYDSVKADDLESLLSKGAEVFGEFTGTDNKPFKFSAYSSDEKTHQALLINIRPIAKPKPVTVKEIIKMLDDYKISDIPDFQELRKRIEANGISTTQEGA